MKIADLIREAERARHNARSGYSGFKVGAAVETVQGGVFGGCNIENASYGLTVCAERVAIWKALSEGSARFRRIAIIADTDSLISPCGACRQIIWEFCGNIEVIVANLKGKRRRYHMSELLPYPFDGGSLG